MSQSECEVAVVAILDELHLAGVAVGELRVVVDMLKESGGLSQPDLLVTLDKCLDVQELMDVL